VILVTEHANPIQSASVSCRSSDHDTRCPHCGQPMTSEAGPRTQESAGEISVSIVLPVLNEELSVPPVVERIESAMRPLVASGTSYEVVFIDDGSNDGSWALVQSLLEQHPDWQAARFTRRFGHQAALLAGLTLARGKAVITMDSDGQHPPELLPQIIEKWQAGTRVVQMVREETQDASWFKRMTSRVFYRLFAWVCEIPISPAVADFRLMDRLVVDAILRGSRPVPFLRGLVPWLNFPSVDIPYRPADRFAGQTKYSFPRMFRLAVDGLMSFSIAPLKLGIWGGLIVGLLAFAYLMFVVLMRLFTEQWLPGWASTAGLIALLGGAQLFFIGLIGEYLGRLYLLNLNHPRYVIRESIERRNPSES
jgi:dolichol-phosphate mannosyltransferase